METSSTALRKEQISVIRRPLTSKHTRDAHGTQVQSVHVRRRFDRLGVVLWGMLVLAGCAASARGSAAAPATLSSGDGSAGTEETLPTPPLEGGLAQVLGHSLADIFQAVELARRDFIVDCTAKRGWTLNAEQRDNLAATAPAQASVASIIDNIRAGRIVPTRPSEVGKEDPAFALAVTECTGEAEAALPNPNTTILAALDQFNKDVADRARTDPRLIHAIADRQTCDGATGYVPADGLSAEGSVGQSIDDLVAQYVASRMSKDEVIRRLGALQDVADLIASCSAAYLRVEALVITDIQDQMLKQQPGLLASISEQAQEQLKQYKRYFSRP
jgi:hypothetical protein